MAAWLARTVILKFMAAEAMNAVAGHYRLDPNPYGQTILVRGHAFYATKYREPGAYFKVGRRGVEDRPDGNVEIGPLEGIQTRSEM